MERARSTPGIQNAMEPYDWTSQKPRVRFASQREREPLSIKSPPALVFNQSRGCLTQSQTRQQVALHADFPRA